MIDHLRFTFWIGVTLGLMAITLSQTVGYADVEPWMMVVLGVLLLAAMGLDVILGTVR